MSSFTVDLAALLNFCKAFENDQIDLNGDGDKEDFGIPHLYDLSTGKMTNLGLSLSEFRSPIVDGNIVALQVDERMQGNTDLNEDGDTGDDVLHIYDHSTGETTNLELASGFTEGRFSFSTHRVNENLITFHVHEDDQGNTDLNRDGDTEDRVLHVYDHFTGSTINLKLTVGVSAAGGNIITFLLDESDQGVDLNRDGDATDYNIIHIYDISSGVTTNLGLAGHVSSIDGNIIEFTVDERDQGNTDLNGDGDIEDNVLHVVELIEDDVSEDELFCGKDISEYDSVIEGTNENDLLQGTSGDDLIFGMDGNDLIFASNGNDCIFGGNGNDTIFGRGGNDIMFGDDGDDTLFGAMGDDILNGGEGNDHLLDDNGNDTLDGKEGDDLCFDKYGNNTFESCKVKNE